MPRLFFAQLASGLAPSAALGGERGTDVLFPDVFAACLKSLNGKEWQERRIFFIAGLWDGASHLPHGSAGTSGKGVMGRCYSLPSHGSYPRNHPGLEGKVAKGLCCGPGISGRAACHQPWDEQLGRSHTSSGQALRAGQISSVHSGCSYLPFPLLRLSLPRFLSATLLSPDCGRHDSSVRHPFPRPALPWCDSSGPTAQESPRSIWVTAGGVWPLPWPLPSRRPARAHASLEEGEQCSIPMPRCLRLGVKSKTNHELS